jgi:hypothetical protein
VTSPAEVPVPARIRRNKPEAQVQAVRAEATAAAEANSQPSAQVDEPKVIAMPEKILDGYRQNITRRRQGDATQVSLF